MPYLSDLYFQVYKPDDHKRKPVVLIHGAGGWHLSWPSEIRRLTGCRVYVPDLPGHGKSKGHGLQRIAAFGEAIQKWIYALELPKFYLAGHSMGGAIALWFSLEHPELLQGLVLMSTGAQLPVNLSLIEDLSSPKRYSGAVNDICRWSFSQNADKKIVEVVRDQMLKLRPSVLEADFLACDAFDLGKKLPEVQVPTLVMVGQEDKMTPVRFSEQLVEAIPDAALKIIPEAGHMLPLEKPRVVAEALIRYFKAGWMPSSIA